MFNDGNEKKHFFDEAFFIAMFVFVLLVLLLVGAFGWRDSINANLENEDKNIQAEPLATVEYQEVEPSNDFAYEETVAVCEHNWVISKKDSTLIRTVNLSSVASEGIEKVYLTRHRNMFEETTGDIYIAYDENLEDITLLYWDGVFEIEYIPAGVDIETPRMEEYEFTLYDCENCNEFKHVSAEKLTMYKFYIPEGTYLISH